VPFPLATPIAFPITKTPLPVYETLRLKNGKSIFLFSDDTAEALKISLFFNAGAKNNHKPLLATTVSSLWKQGTKNLSGAEFAEAIDGFGAYLSVSSGNEFTEISIHTLNRYFEPVMNLVLDMITNPGFNQKDLTIDSANRRQRISTEFQKTSYTVSALFNEAALGSKHPLGQIAKPEDAENISMEDVLGFYRNFLKNGLHSVIVAGKVTGTIQDWFAGNLGLLETDITRKIGSSSPTPSNEKQLFYAHPAATQSSIMVGCTLFNRFHPDFPALRPVSVLLGGYFGSRLMSNLREDKGYTYGISSSIRLNYSYGHFVIRTDVGGEVTKDAIDQIYLELTKLINEPVGIDELELVKSYMLGVSLRSVDGALAQADLMTNLLNYGLDAKAIQTNLDAIQNLSPESLQLLAQKYLKPEAMTIAIAGKDNIF
jgi:predicted Zn-dependent peptidase